MRAVFPDAMVEGYQPLLATMANSPKDRHVLAAAIRGQAAVIVTANLKDFTAPHLQPYDLAALHPDDLRRDQLDLYPMETLAALAEMRRHLVDPQLTMQELLDRLYRTVPQFVDEVRAVQDSSHPTLLVDEAALSQLGENVDLPLLVQASDDETYQAFFPNGIEAVINTPRAVGFLWHAALLNFDDLRGELDALTWNPAALGDWSTTRQMVTGMALASGVIESLEGPDRLAYMRMVEDTGSPMRAVGDVMVAAIVITLVRRPDGTWCVWGIGPHFPTANEVILK